MGHRELAAKSSPEQEAEAPPWGAPLPGLSMASNRPWCTRNSSQFFKTYWGYSCTFHLPPPIQGATTLQHLLSNLLLALITQTHTSRGKGTGKEILTVAGLHLLRLCSQCQAHPRVVASASGFCTMFPAGSFFSIFKHSLPSSLFSGFANHNYLVSFISFTATLSGEEQTGTPGKRRWYDHWLKIES